MRKRKLYSTIAVAAAATVTAGVALMSSPAEAAAIGGIDVSHYQGAIDWKRVKDSGQAFAFMKATEGTSFKDKRYADNFRGAGDHGIARAAYHFARPDKGANDAVNEARFFIEYAGKHDKPGDLAPVLDLEAAGDLAPRALADWTKAFLGEVERLTGRVPIIYTGPSFWQTKMGDSKEFDRYPLWIAHYTSGQPKVPSGWKGYTFWQFTSSGSVPGIGGRVDQNRFHGNAEDLKRLTNPGTPPKPEPPKPEPPKPEPPKPSPSTSASPSPTVAPTEAPPSSAPAVPMPKPKPELPVTGVSATAFVAGGALLLLAGGLALFLATRRRRKFRTVV